MGLFDKKDVWNEDEEKLYKEGSHVNSLAIDEQIVYCSDCGVLLKRRFAQRVRVIDDEMSCVEEITYKYFCKLHKKPYEEENYHSGLGWRYYKIQPSRRIEVDKKGKKVKR